METRANHVVIGLFVLSLLGLILGFIYWIKNDASGTEGKNYFVLFDGSVQGLTEASPVQFNGIRFGAVRKLELVPEDTRKVRVSISVGKDMPVRTNSRARVSQQGLAGLVALEVTPGTPDAPLLQPKPGETPPTIIAELGGSASVFAGLSDAAGNANALLIRLNNLVANNEDSLRHTLANLDTFTTTIAAHKDDVVLIIQNLREFSSSFSGISKKVEAAIEKIASDNPDSAVAKIQQAAASFRQLADKLDHTIGDKASGLTDQTTRSLREFELLMKDTRRLADSLDRVVQKVERNPAGFLLGGQSTPKY